MGKFELEMYKPWCDSEPDLTLKNQTLMCVCVHACLSVYLSFCLSDFLKFEPVSFRHGFSS